MIISDLYYPKFYPLTYFLINWQIIPKFLSIANDWINRWFVKLNPLLNKIPQLAITATSVSAFVLLLSLNQVETVSMIPFILFLIFYWAKMANQWRKT